MTHLLNLEILQFAAEVKENYTGVLNLKLNCLISRPKQGVHNFCRNFNAAHWLHNLAKFPKSS